MSAKAVSTAVKDAPPPALSESQALMAMIERVASNPEIDLDRFDRLIKMRNDLADRENKAAYAASMSRAQGRMGPVVATLRNDQTKSNYADLAAIAEAITPIYTEEGLSISFSTIPSEPDHQGIQAEVFHASGYSRIYDFQVPLDGAGIRGNANKTATHAYGSTLTYGRRYAKLMIFDIATKDDKDGNQSKKETIVKDFNALRELLIKTGVTEQWVCQHNSIGELEDMNQQQYEEAWTGLNAKLRKIAMTPRGRAEIASRVEAARKNAGSTADGE